MTFLAIGYTPSMNSYANYNDWSLKTVMHWGEAAIGQWTVIIEGVQTGHNQNAKVNYIRVNIHGHNASKQILPFRILHLLHQKTLLLHQILHLHLRPQNHLHQVRFLHRSLFIFVMIQTNN